MAFILGALRASLAGAAAPPACSGRPVTVWQPANPTVPNECRCTPGDDVVVGSDGADSIYDNGGNDLICARGGRDYVEGNRGDDSICGGLGGDTVIGNQGADDLSDHTGNDALAGKRAAIRATAAPAGTASSRAR